MHSATDSSHTPAPLDVMKLISGTAHPDLAKGIAAYLKTRLTDATVSAFPDGETYVKINENIRGQDVFIIQPTSPPTNVGWSATSRARLRPIASQWIAESKRPSAISSRTFSATRRANSRVSCNSGKMIA